jgi:4-amino-4-deoxy-L-arabinose transferase-like glycosyltransferase
MSIRLRTIATAAGLFLFALGMRLAYLEQAKSDPMSDVVHRIWDSLYYHRHALALAGIDPRVDPVGSVPYFLGPLYSYFLAGVYALFLPDPGLAKQAQAVLGALSCVLVFGIGRALFGERAGLVAGLLLACYGLAIYYAGVLLPASLELLLNLLFLWLLVRGERAPDWRAALAAGVVAGLATAAKTNAVLLVPAGMAVLWFAPPRLPKATRLRTLAALALGAALAIAPFTLRNWVVSHQFVVMNTTGGRNLWKGWGPNANGTHVPLVSPSAEGGARDPRERWTDLDDYLERRVDARRATEESSYFTQKTIAYVIERPVRALALGAKKLLLFANAIELGNRDRYYFARRYSPLLQLPLPSFGLIASLGLAGAAFAWRRRPRTALVYAFLAVQVASYVIVFVLARYRIVAAAALCLFAGWLVVEGWDALRGRRWRSLAAGLVAVLVAAAVVHVPVGFGRERGFASAHYELGYHYLQRGEARAAVAELERALAHGDWADPDLDATTAAFKARLELAQAWLEQGEKERGKAMLRDLLTELGDASPEHAKLRRSAERQLRRLEFRRTPTPDDEPDLEPSFD